MSKLRGGKSQHRSELWGYARVCQAFQIDWQQQDYQSRVDPRDYPLHHRKLDWSPSIVQSGPRSSLWWKEYWRWSRHDAYRKEQSNKGVLVFRDEAASYMNGKDELVRLRWLLSLCWFKDLWGCLGIRDAFSSFRGSDRMVTWWETKLPKLISINAHLVILSKVNSGRVSRNDKD